MLLGMTGFGSSTAENDRLSVQAEIRTVNNRYLKISTRYPDFYAKLGSQIEKLLRSAITRGTVNLTLRIDHLNRKSDYLLDDQVVQQYWEQLKKLTEECHLPLPDSLDRLLTLPGAVIDNDSRTHTPESDWPLIEEAIKGALVELTEFRQKEGESAQADLQSSNKTIGEQLETVKQKAPQVVTSYRDRLYQRLTDLLKDQEVELDPDSLIREVSLFADRCDINEEISRLTCHLEQFDTILNSETSQGKKLEFLVQEMFREINTIGSKANDVEISHAVIEMKLAVEKIRENVQNVE
ncbi:YicC family protein [Gimesia chilikensis]|uniref:YicC/YloC family endoribonuclease n=1 Tax=Gimesia chilikensis TaxID=2605989 RepID=UPI0011EE8A44|nr:YicC/YloC family endoribonuclease [Gimesia chilikensis]KAA0131656.1 YicC family protein [Gimesia chilikensis]